MNIHLICWARNEADILEAHVRHHLQWATSCSYVLHRPRDNSVAILQQLQDEGLPVDFRVDERLFHEQATVMNALMQQAVQDGADWILPLDADEFLRGDVSAELMDAALDCPLQVEWKTYVPLAGHSVSDVNILKRIIYRRASERPPWHKMLVPRALAAVSTLTLGNHGVCGSDGIIKKAKQSALSLAHFPVRSSNQIRKKIFGAWLSHVADPARTSGASFQWKAVFDDCKKNAVFSPHALQDLAQTYATIDQWKTLSVDMRNAPWQPMEDAPADRMLVEDPVPCHCTVTIPIIEADPLEVLLDTSEALAMAYAQELRAAGEGNL